MTSWLGARLVMSGVLVGVTLAPARAQVRPMGPVQRLETSTPFAQVKATDASGVSYRVGAVFSAAGNAAQRVSVTFICRTGGALSLYVVQSRVPQDRAHGPALSFQVDSQPIRRVTGRREIGNGLSAYTIGAEAQALAKAMGAGKNLLMTLDERAYALSLEGLGAELAELAGVCPHGVSSRR
jgi:hypothetical protein